MDPMFKENQVGEMESEKLGVTVEEPPKSRSPAGIVTRNYGYKTGDV